MRKRDILLRLLLLSVCSVFPVLLLLRRSSSSAAQRPQQHQPQQLRQQQQQQQQRSGPSGAGAVPGAGSSSSAAAAAAAGSASQHFRALINIHKLQVGTEIGPIYHPHFSNNLFPPDGAYPVLVVADAFLSCRPGKKAVVLMSRHFQRRPDLDHALLAVEVLPAAGSSAAPLQLPPCSWFIERHYETVAIGHCAYDAGALCLPGAQGHVSLRVTYNASVAEAIFNVTAPPEPPASDFAMVTVFSFSRFLLPLWMQYWRALGVDTFYLFYNGPTEDVHKLQAEVASFEGSVVVINVRDRG
jgi:hypothetical protein